MIWGCQHPTTIVLTDPDMDRHPGPADPDMDPDLSPFQSYVQTKSNFFQKNFNMLSKILKIMAPRTLLRKVKQFKLALL
jgi:hypothetical protein